jgi:hypothetical protein
VAGQAGPINPGFNPFKPILTAFNRFKPILTCFLKKFVVLANGHPPASDFSATGQQFPNRPLGTGKRVRGDLAVSHHTMSLPRD